MIAMAAVLRLVFLFLLCCVGLTRSLPRFLHGRPRGGMVGAPRRQTDGPLPPDQWLEQKLDHFNDADLRTWKQVRWRRRNECSSTHTQLICCHTVTIQCALDQLLFLSGIACFTSCMLGFIHGSCAAGRTNWNNKYFFFCKTTLLVYSYLVLRVLVLDLFRYRPLSFPSPVTS